MTKGLAKIRLKHVLKMNTELCKEIVYNLPLEMGSGSDVQKNNFKMIQPPLSDIWRKGGMQVYFILISRF